MKTKLTLTVKKSIIDSAKRIAKRKQVSVSKLFEEMFKNDTISPIKSPEQLAAKELLDRNLSESPTVADPRSDKALIRAHVARKYA